MPRSTTLRFAPTEPLRERPSAERPPSHPVRLVRTAGLEPALPCRKQILSLLRLPVSPRPRVRCSCHRPKPRASGLALDHGAAVPIVVGVHNFRKTPAHVGDDA